MQNQMLYGKIPKTEETGEGAHLRSGVQFRTFSGSLISRVNSRLAQLKYFDVFPPCTVPMKPISTSSNLLAWRL
jgi:hypothetical protein